MPRYIDADELKDKYYDKMVELLKHTTSNMSEEALSLLCGYTLINAMPTADVVELEGSPCGDYLPEKDKEVEVCGSGSLEA